MENVFLLKGYINAQKASAAISYLLECDKRNVTAVVLINSTGGDVTSVMAVHDTMKYCSNRIVTAGAEEIGGLGALLLAAGTSGYRFVCRDTKVYEDNVISSFASRSPADRELLTQTADKVYLACCLENTSFPYDKILNIKAQPGKLFGKSEKKRYEAIWSAVKEISDA